MLLFQCPSVDTERGKCDASQWRRARAVKHWCCAFDPRRAVNSSCGHRGLSSDDRILFVILNRSSVPYTYYIIYTYILYIYTKLRILLTSFVPSTPPPPTTNPRSPPISDTADANANVVKCVFTCVVKKYKTITLKDRRKREKSTTVRCIEQTITNSVMFSL